MTALTGMTAFVTGATGAIASAAALALARDGARLVLMARRAEGLSKTVADIRAQVPAAQITEIVGDCCEEAAVKAALHQAHGLADRLDVAFATVGGAAFTPLLMLEADTLRHDLELNLMSAFHVIRHAAPLMRPGGSIICTSSVTAQMSFPYLTTYHVAKAGLEGLVRSAADELGSAGIRVNAIRPGMTRANSTEAAFAAPGALDPFLPEYPLGRLGEPEDIAGAVRYLAGPESAWVTGQFLAIDGGTLLRRSPDLTAMVETIYGHEAVSAARAGRETES